MQGCIYQVKQAQSLHTLCAFVTLRWEARPWGLPWQQQWNYSELKIISFADKSPVREIT